MSLVVEDGSGIDNADSFLSLVDARALAVNYGYSIDADDTLAEIQLRNSYRGLLISEPSLQGKRSFSMQTGIFPRSGVLSNCNEIASNVIPLDVKLAQISYVDAIASGLELNTVNDGLRLAGFSVDGVYSETYQDGISDHINSRIQGVYNALYPLTAAGFNSSPCGGGNGYGSGLGREEFGIVGI